MPIGEAHKSGESFSGLAEYILAQGIYAPDYVSKKPEIIFRNHVYASDYLSLGKEFRAQAKENQRVKKPVMHLTVNFKTADEISSKSQKLFVQKVMSEMGVKNDNHQYVVVQHNDKHPHYHIIINRVGLDGITLSDTNSKLRIGTAVDKIEKEMGLDNYLEKTRAFIYDPVKGYKINENREIKKGLPRIQMIKDRKVGIQDKKNFVQKNVLKILNNPRTTTIKDLKIQLSHLNIELRHTVNVKQQIAVSFRYEGLAVKGTQIQLKGALIKKQLEANLATLNQFNEKNNVNQFASKMASRLDSSLKEIIDTYKTGISPDMKKIFAKNDIVFDEKSKFTYEGNQLDVKAIITFEKHCREKLESAKNKFAQDTARFEMVSKQKYKNGVFGLLTPEQKRFNEILSLEKVGLVKPALNVEINLDEIYNPLTNQFTAIFRDIREMPVENIGAYAVDYNFLEDEKENKIQKVETQKEISSPLPILQQIGGSADEDEELKRKRRFKR